MEEWGVPRQAPSSARTVRLMEAALLALPGVIASRVELDAEGRVQAVHVLAGPGRAEGQLVRDVQSLMAVSFGQAVAPGMVGVTRIGMEGEAVQSRLRLLRHRTETDGNQLKVRVELGQGGRTFHGEARGVRNPTVSMRLAAMATAQAVVAALSHTVEVEVFAVHRVTVAHHSAALVGVTAGGGLMAPQDFLGAVLIRSDEVEAACRAVLDGVNRFLSLACQLAPEGITVACTNG